MKIAVTGATGFVGRQLVPLLAADGHDLLLLGRDKTEIVQLFPHFVAGDYEDLTKLTDDVDLLVHLAVLNNNAQRSPDEFRQVNVSFFNNVLAAAKLAGIKRVVNFSSFHALNSNDQTPYAVSKREALELARGAQGVEVINLFLPAVHGSAFAGKLAVLNKLPTFLSKLGFAILSSLAPTVDVRKIAAFLSQDSFSVDAGDDVCLVDPKSGNLVFRAVKKTGDLVFALAVVLFFWWVLLLAWIWIRLTSPGPGIFKQTRVGQNGEPFTCYKFRTMRLDTEQVGTHDVSASAITSAGQFLRRTKIDELPQIWNILRGEISLVGPRPCLPVQKELVDARNRRGVLAVIPGITGYAQINGVDMSDPEELAKWDERYIQMRSLVMDLKIILATFVGKGQGDKVSK